jgi:murein DD-endopeptidase MepM/ murein hydrolase activator NlpD
VIIAHSETLQTWYAHIDNAVNPPAVAAGDTVVGGEVIAYVGMTGRSTGPHLHWGVVYNDAFVNPRLFV